MDGKPGVWRTRPASAIWRWRCRGNRPAGRIGKSGREKSRKLPTMHERRRLRADASRMRRYDALHLPTRKGRHHAHQPAAPRFHLHACAWRHGSGGALRSIALHCRVPIKAAVPPPHLRGPAAPGLRGRERRRRLPSQPGALRTGSGHRCAAAGTNTKPHRLQIRAHLCGRRAIAGAGRSGAAHCRRRSPGSNHRRSLRLTFFTIIAG